MKFLLIIKKRMEYANLKLVLSKFYHLQSQKILILSNYTLDFHFIVYFKIYIKSFQISYEILS
jgi:hypothetical protein